MKRFVPQRANLALKISQEPFGVWCITSWWSHRVLEQSSSRKGTRMRMNLCFRRSVQTKLVIRRNSPGTTLAILCSGLLLAATPPLLEGQNAYIDHHLVSDLPGEADVTDTNLVNPWALLSAPRVLFGFPTTTLAFPLFTIAVGPPQRWLSTFHLLRAEQRRALQPESFSIAARASQLLRTLPRDLFLRRRMGR